MRQPLLLSLIVLMGACNTNLEEPQFCYPNGRMKALVMSYDDGTIEDVKLAALFDRTGIVGTFNLNSGYIDSVRGWPQESGDTIWQAYITKEDLGSIYAGHEIAAHGVYHKDFVQVSMDEVRQEVEDDIANLEAWTGRSITSLAYPFGSTNGEVAELVGKTGLTNARTIKDTHGFGLPDDYLRWHPTCHDSRAMEHVDAYLDLQPETPTLFYVWGHSWELKDPDRWDQVNAFCERIGHHKDIWYTGTGALAEYLLALERVTLEDNTLINPADNSPIWLTGPDGPFVLNPGQEVSIEVG